MSRAALIVVVGLALGVGCGDGATRTDTNDIEESITIDSTNSGTASNLLTRTITRTRRVPRQFAFFPYPASLVLQHATPAMVTAATKVRPATFQARVSSPAFRHPTPRSSTRLVIIRRSFLCLRRLVRTRQCDRRSSMPEYVATTASAAPQGRSVSVSLPTPISAHSDFAEFQLKTTKMTKMPAIVSLPEQAARPAMTSAVAIATSVIVTNFSTYKKTSKRTPDVPAIV